MASQAIGKSRAYNLLNSEDVNSAINSVKKLGIKVIKTKDYVEVIGNGLITTMNQVIKERDLQT